MVEENLKNYNFNNDIRSHGSRLILPDSCLRQTWSKRIRKRLRYHGIENLIVIEVLLSGLDEGHC